MSFAGIDGKARYKNTLIEKLLPVQIQESDDRVEVPEGIDLRAGMTEHPIFQGIPEEWPYILGYNRTKCKENAEILMEYKGDPIIATGFYGKGRTAAYTTDCTPHWAPPEMYQWEYYGRFWDRMCLWLSGNL